MTRPTPTAIKKLAGNPGKRPYNERELTPTKGAPVCPHWIQGEARDEWNRIVPELDAQGVLTAVDNAVLIGHCVTYAEIVATVQAGEPLKAALLAQMRAYASELGLSPAARAKLPLTKKDESDDLDQFFVSL